MAGDADHARQRRALSHAFSTKALLEQEYIVKGYVDTFSDKMRGFAQRGQQVNVTDWFAYTTFDIIGRAVIRIARVLPVDIIRRGHGIGQAVWLLREPGLPLLGAADQRFHQGRCS